MTTTTDPVPQNQQLRSVCSSSLAEIFAQLTLSLMVSTYQAGKVILIVRTLARSTPISARFPSQWVRR